MCIHISHAGVYGMYRDYMMCLTTCLGLLSTVIYTCIQKAMLSKWYCVMEFDTYQHYAAIHVLMFTLQHIEMQPYSTCLQEGLGQ